MYLAHMTLRARLHQWFPKWVAEPALQRIWREHVSYMAVVKQLQMDGNILIGVMVVAAVAACVAVALAVGRLRVLPFLG